MVQDGNLYGVSSQGTNMHATKAETRPTGSLPHQPNPGCYVGLWNIEKSGAKQPLSWRRARALGGGHSLPGPHCLCFLFLLFF